MLRVALLVPRRVGDPRVDAGEHLDVPPGREQRVDANRRRGQPIPRAPAGRPAPGRERTRGTRVDRRSTATGTRRPTAHDLPRFVVPQAGLGHDELLHRARRCRARRSRCRAGRTRARHDPRRRRARARSGAATRVPGARPRDGPGDGRPRCPRSAEPRPRRGWPRRPGSRAGRAAGAQRSRTARRRR